MFQLFARLCSDSALGALTTRMQVQLAKDIHLSGDKKKTSLYAYVSKLVFQASVASLFTPEAAEDPVLFDAFRAFDEHLPLAAGGYKVSRYNEYLFNLSFLIFVEGLFSVQYRVKLSKHILLFRICV